MKLTLRRLGHASPPEPSQTQSYVRFLLFIGLLGAFLGKMMAKLKHPGPLVDARAILNDMGPWDCEGLFDKTSAVTHNL